MRQRWQSKYTKGGKLIEIGSGKQRIGALNNEKAVELGLKG